MRILSIKYAGNTDYLGTRKYAIYEGEKLIGIFLSKEAKIVDVVNEYLKIKRETDILIEFDEEDDTRKY